MKKNVIKSIADSDQEILNNIKYLYLNNELFDLDPTYSKGNIYKNIEKPILKFDLNPLLPEIIQQDVTKLSKYPFKKTLKSIVFDPPFMFGMHGKQKENIMTKRFTMFDSWEQLEKMYKQSLKEFYKILKKGGIVAFKCQDFTDSKTTLTHSFVIQWALEVGFKTEDLFIKISKSRIFNPKVKQRHARKFHSYWIVFKK